MFDLGSEFISLVNLLITTAPAIWFAERSARKKVCDTLRRMKAETLTREGVVSAEINHTSQRLSIVLSDGLDFSVSVADLHLTLKKMRSEEERQAEVAQFVDHVMSLSTLPKLSAETLEFLYPVVAASNPLSIQSMRELATSYRREMAPGLACYLVLRRGIRVAYLTEAEIREATFAEEYLRNLALENLRRTLEQMAFHEVSDNPWIAQITLDGFHECALMLLPEVWDDLAARHGPVAVACPQIGTLLVGEAGSMQGIELLGKYCAEAREEARFPVSYGVYCWKDGGWKLLS